LGIFVAVRGKTTVRPPKSNPKRGDQRKRGNDMTYVEENKSYHC